MQWRVIVTHGGRRKYEVVLEYKKQSSIQAWSEAQVVYTNNYSAAVSTMMNQREELILRADWDGAVIQTESRQPAPALTPTTSATPTERDEVWYYRTRHINNGILGYWTISSEQVESMERELLSSSIPCVCFWDSGEGVWFARYQDFKAGLVPGEEEGEYRGKRRTPNYRVYPQELKERGFKFYRTLEEMGND